MHLDDTYVPGLGDDICCHCLVALEATDDVSRHTRHVSTVNQERTLFVVRKEHDYAHTACAMRASEVESAHYREWEYLGVRTSKETT